MAKGKEKVTNEVEEVKKTIDSLVERAQVALRVLETMDQETIDNIVHQMAIAGLAEHMPLAKLAVEETGRGVFEDKCIKNIFATEYIWQSIKYDRTCGIISEDPHTGVTQIAEPVGVVCGVTPTTNPTSTTLFKALISIKTRNPIIFAFHPSAQKSSAAAAKVVLDAAVAAGAPKDCVLWIEKPSIEATQQLMNHEGVALVLATGGAGMVKAAYSTGKPALGVGPGNVPAYIEKTADIERAVNDVILSKTFDNGMICASEQAIIVDKEIYNEVVAEMKANKCYFPTKDEIAKLEDVVINPKTNAVNAEVVGMTAEWIAEKAGIKVPAGTKVLVAELPAAGPEYPLSREKLSPVLACIKVDSTEEGFKQCENMLNLGGLGHTAAIHSRDTNLQREFGIRMKANRLAINAPTSQGGIGDVYNGFIPSLTLGCGSHGKNSVSQNVSAVNLINIKKLGERRKNMQWFKLPPKMYFEKHSTQYLEKMPRISRAFIVTDPGMVELGYADIVVSYLKKNRGIEAIEMFSQVEPDPSDVTVYKGAEMMREFEPDVIISLGGGSPMDAAKAMWLFYEHPKTTFFGIQQKFMDIRKRTVRYPKMGEKAQFVAIPTTSGTGSEVTPFAVITDKAKGTKYPLADYELTPDVAIIDPQYVISVPASVTADTGMDVLTHAIESYVSVMASDYSDGLALKAIELVFQYLPRSVKNGAGDEEAREKMHNASTIAGMAFANAFLGINHSLAHKVGGEYGTPHGRTNAILMPHVIRYNAQTPKKRALFPKYEKFIADERYAQIARMLGLKADTVEQGVESLAKAVTDLAKEIGIEMSFKAQGIDKKDFMSKVDYLAERAFEDQCTTANPKMPLVSELAEILRQSYEG